MASFGIGWGVATYRTLTDNLNDITTIKSQPSPRINTN